MINLIGSYNPILVTFSIFIAIITSYTALELVERIRTQDNTTFAWLIASSITMGTGIWSMHFVGMLAYSIGIPINYDLTTIILSCFLAIIASAIVFFFLNQGLSNLFDLCKASILMASGISLMHYFGMSAMQISVEINYNYLVVSLSFIFAVVLSTISLSTANYVIQGDFFEREEIKIAASFLMGITISGMHYIGMIGIIITPTSLTPEFYIKIPNSSLAYIVTTITILVICSSLIFSIRSQKKDLQNLTNRLKDSSNILECFNQELEERVEKRTAELILAKEIAEATSVKLQLEVAERKKVQQTLEYNSLHDSLTGLANRFFFMEQLKLAFNKLKRYPELKSAVLFLDLDRFKVINDTLGHYYGDLLLIEVASRLKKSIREIDMVARLGGDEFTILLENLKNYQDATKVAQRTNSEIAKPFYLHNHKVETTASIGIAFGSYADFGSCDQFLQSADLAMYHAKEKGKNCYVIFEQEMSEKAEKVIQMERELKLALKQQQFCLYYQPIVCLNSNKIIGFEALLRWQHPNKGLLKPGQFISIIEESNLIIPIGYWIIEEICKQIKIWQKTIDFSQFYISVNISARQLKEPNFVQKLTTILKNLDVNSTHLRLEITESLLIENLKLANITLNQLKKLGLEIYLDDFGTGYSSLSCLHYLPIDQLKIDRTFIQNIGLKTQSLEIIRAIINLANNLGIKVIAEGVENYNQFELLKTLNCSLAQGYLFSYPIDNISAAYLMKNKYIHQKKSA